MEQVQFKRARTEEHKRQRAATLMEAARSLALATGAASVTLTAVAERAGVHHSAVRRYFSSHQDILLHLAAESWTRWSDTVCAELRAPGPMSPARLAATLANALVGEPLFCDLLACLPVRLEREVNVEQVVEFKRVCYPAVMSLTDAVERALPALGRQGAVDMVSAATALAGALWQAAHPSEAVAHALDAEPVAPPEWNVDFEPTLTRLLTATCVGLVA
ncbi:TetR family transcriptional regulator [Mycobacterium talmoniae]|uniref:TetR family transcriptional regulator n=1 Tax=Mycobacterium talmoniae TaxID=1858794 RepID=A0A1S1N394_9MYCO|nr:MULTISPECIES: TetR family transcriptional regulator [Mycobacterium]OHU95662.1 TetR family transcriptional regulator [Mycobacterium talmoniae]TDH51262.1 TetR/AcrR family transcriptional regulator [Mycobacterium eburneum]